MAHQGMCPSPSVHTRVLRVLKLIQWHTAHLHAHPRGATGRELRKVAPTLEFEEWQAGRGVDGVARTTHP